MRIPSKFTIPDTIEGVAGLLTARGWERAAIVWAYVHSSENQAHVKTDMRGKLYTPESFAALGLSGLRSKNTVQAYWQAWQDAMKKRKAKAVKPGDTIEVPDLTFPSTDTTSPAARPNPYDEEYEVEANEAGIPVSVAKRAGQNKAAVAAAIMADPEVEKVAREAVIRKEDQRMAATARKKITDKIAPVDGTLSQREIDAADAEFDALLMKLRGMRRIGQEALSLTLNIGGFDQKAKRALVIESVDGLRTLLDAIAEAAQGRSMDDELQALLNGGN
jgi:hypothetical protein